MHKYLKAIGLTISSSKELRKILKEVEHKFTRYELMEIEENVDFCEFQRAYNESMGIAVLGKIDETGQFERDFYLPYFKGNGITSYADIIVERSIEKDTYMGVCEDIKVGINLIFRIVNGISYMRELQIGNIPKKFTSVTLSGLANGGMILFPVQKDEQEIKMIKSESRNRMQLMNAAKKGDEAAMESLTLEDMDIYSSVARRLIKEDVLSIVDTYFMPYGIESDQYSVLGEIISFHIKENSYSCENVYIFTLNVNELQFDICVPEKELVGEPKIGRRFKGTIWLQGYINF